MTNKKNTTLDRLKHKYRLVILNDDTLEEKFSYRLSELNIYIGLSTLLVVLVALTVFIIVITPLKEYIPGYGDTSMRRHVFQVAESTDSLETVILKQQAYITNIQSLLAGENGTMGQSKSEEEETKGSYADSVDLGKISQEELALREEVEQQDNYDLLGGIEAEQYFSNSMEMYFFAPIKGYVSDGFDTEKEHFGIDIVAPENEAIKAIGDGIVVLSDWTLETGHVLAIQHHNNLISFYKHNSVLLKKVGNFVKAGDAIAIIGDSGEGSTGPHLHFELWHNQTPVDPLKYINVN